MQLIKFAKILTLSSLVLLIVSYPACRYGEQLVQPELAKLSATERELHQFDPEYTRFVLPGVLAFLTGSGLGVAGIVMWIVGFITGRKR